MAHLLCEAHIYASIQNSGVRNDRNYHGFLLRLNGLLTQRSRDGPWSRKSGLWFPQIQPQPNQEF